MGPDEIFIGIQQDFFFKGYPLWFRPHPVTDMLLEVTDRRGLKDMGRINRVWTKTITDILLEFTERRGLKDLALVLEYSKIISGGINT
jgi:hypothetical protein